MNCPNCKKDLVTGYECDNAACVALRPAAVVEAPSEVVAPKKRAKKK